MPCPCKSIHGCAHFHTPSPIYRTIHSSGARCLCAQAPSRAFAVLQSAAAALAFPPAARFAESRPYAADFPAVAIHYIPVHGLNQGFSPGMARRPAEARRSASCAILSFALAPAAANRAKRKPLYTYSTVCGGKRARRPDERLRGTGRGAGSGKRGKSGVKGDGAARQATRTSRLPQRREVKGGL